jgi:putative selenium metabolism protein SsnA
MLITHANLITWEEPNRILEDYAVYIEKDLIQAIGPNAEMEKSYPAAERLEAHGQYVMPGNICAHTHYYGAFARGMAIPGAAPESFPEILGKLWWPLDKALTEEDIRYSTLACLVDALKHGTTSLVDHHASPNALSGSLDIVAQAVDEAGLRSVLCYEVTDRDGEAKARAGIAENVRFIERARRERIAGGRVAATFGLHASLTLSDATLELCREALPTGAGFHIHCAESDADEYDSLAKSGLRVVDRLEKHAILGPHTLVAHAVYVDAAEINLLAQSETWVSHQPRSNMNNGVGAAPVESMLRAGVNVCLGNDGLSNTMWKEWEAAYLVHKVWNRDPRRLPASEVARMAVTNNSRLMKVFYPEAPIGVIQPGAYADLIFVDYHPTTPLHAGNLPWHIVFGFNESMVTTTLVAGKVLVLDRQVLTLDEAAITARSRELAVMAWKRYETNVSKFVS